MKDKFIKNIKLLLEEKHMTQRELAEKLGTTEASVSRYVSGDRVPKGPVIVEIAKALETTPNYLLGFAERKMTNADRIRRMSDEELAEFLCMKTRGCNKCETDGICLSHKRYYLEWLQKEVEE